MQNSLLQQHNTNKSIVDEYLLFSPIDFLYLTFVFFKISVELSFYETLWEALFNYLNRWHEIDLFEIGARGKYRRHNKHARTKKRE